MTKLPEKGLLSGSKTPHTTTGEMKEALGKLRDYLNELLGEDSADKEAARQALGIDLKVLGDKIEAKADQETLEETMKNKVDLTLFESKTDELAQEIAKRGAPVGTIEFFAMATPPAGYLRADGAEVGRETWPQLFAAIGTMFGDGNGETTFNLPDLAGRFAQGSMTPGQKIEAGLPNIEGEIVNDDGSVIWAGNYSSSGVFSLYGAQSHANCNVGGTGANTLSFSASKYNPIYGESDTVQPPALTLLPCIKAFDAVTNPGLIDITVLANEMAKKIDKTIDGEAIKYIAATYNDGLNWYRQWSDGWLEQGGKKKPNVMTITFNKPFADTNYYFNYDGIRTSSSDNSYHWHHGRSTTQVNVLLNVEETYWYACGNGKKL